MKGNNSLFAIFSNYSLFEIFILGILSGMPFSVIFTLLVVMMKDMGVALSIVTALALAKLPYSIKFLWSPLIDGLKLGFLSKFGRRKSWMMLLTALNIVFLSIIILIASKQNFQYVLLFAICFGFCAASYDIVYDAWRIERVSESMQVMCGAVAVFGYRIGALITSAGAMYIVGSTGDNWNSGFIFIISCFTACLLFLLSIKDDSFTKLSKQDFNFRKNVIIPFKDFLLRPNAIYILLAIILYKAGEAMLAYVATPFILDLGFTKEQWSVAVKGVGFISTSLGAFCGGVICYKIGTVRGLIFCGFFQMIANLSYIWLGYQGAQINALIITVAIDNLTGGMGAAALVGFLGTLCNKEYTATQYALLSSAATFANGTINAYSGSLVTMFGWTNFFILTVLLSVPGLLILLYLMKRNAKASK